jgi:hypothetical protein
MRPAPRPARATDTIHAAALAYAKRFNLVCTNGQIICSREHCGLEATLPSLLCAEHLAARRRGEP